ncbi:DUF5615 family PIN-like protein [Candidatus Poribacteria bacterium]|nr:DUF5615 family PIN-like protein [Candidatus Poribacteria bacterium]
MPPKLYFDHDMNLTVVPDLRADGYDVKTTPEAKNERASDEKQLDYATHEGRVLVTYNRKDFRRLHRHYLSSGKEHAGIWVSRQLPRNQQSWKFRLPKSQRLRKFLMVFLKIII